MSEPIDISPSQRNELLGLLKRHLPNVEVWAFGSRVKWTARSNSDLDLVAFAKPEDAARVSRLKEALEESSLPFRVDFLVWDNIPENFQRNILECHVVLSEVMEDGPDSAMSSDTPEVPLAEIASIKGGKRLPVGKNLQTVPSKHPYIRVRDVGQRCLPREGIEYVPDEVYPSIARYIVKKNDVVLSIVGTIGALSIVDSFYDQASLTENCVKLTGLDFHDALYLYYYLSSSIGQQEIFQGTVGAVQPKLPIYNIEKIKVLWPDDKGQRKIIAHQLGTLDDKIYLNRRINQTLEAMAQAIFKSWFVDFDPVKAKIAAKQDGRDPLRAAMCAISGKPDAELDAMPGEQFEQLAATAALFPDEMEESELGEIPRGWGIRPMPECIEVNPTRQLKKGVVAPYLDMANVPTNSSRAQTVVLREFASGSKFINGDTLLARITPCLENGKTAFVDFLGNEQVGWGSTEFIVLRPKNGLPVEFAYFLCRHPDFRAFAVAQMAGTSGRQRVPNDCFANYSLTVPSRKVATAFGVIARSVMNQIRVQDEASKTLATLRDTLLPKLLSGELTVNGASDEVIA